MLKENFPLFLAHPLIFSKYGVAGTLMIGMVGCPDRMNLRPAVTAATRLIISECNINAP